MEQGLSSLLFILITDASSTDGQALLPELASGYLRAFIHLREFAQTDRRQIGRWIAEGMPMSLGISLFPIYTPCCTVRVKYAIEPDEKAHDKTHDGDSTQNRDTEHDKAL